MKDGKQYPFDEWARDMKHRFKPANSVAAVATDSSPSDAQIERVARAISRAYIQGFRHAHPHITQWITTLDEAVDLQWQMVCAEAVDALLPNVQSEPRPGDALTQSQPAKGKQ